VANKPNPETSRAIQEREDEHFRSATAAVKSILVKWIEGAVLPADPRKAAYMGAVKALDMVKRYNIYSHRTTLAEQYKILKALKRANPANETIQKHIDEIPKGIRKEADRKKRVRGEAQVKKLIRKIKQSSRNSG